MKPSRKVAGRGPMRGPDKKRADSKKARIIFGVSAAFMVLFGVVAVMARQPDTDPLTGCPTGDRAPEAHTVILIDETDQLSAADVRFGRDLIMTEYRWLPLGGRMTVRNILADPTEAEDISFCRMATESRTGGVLDNDKAIKSQFDRVAGRKLSELFANLAEAPVQTKSPIMESVASTMDRSDFGSNVDHRRLVIYSDMAQHSDLYSNYSSHGRRNSGPSEEALEELSRDMSDVDVRLQYIRRRSLARIQGSGHKEFWKNYFTSMDANVAIGHDLLLGEPEDRETWVAGSG
ncbi:hypothetical protein [uncultured Brevundimonas sp.]|uniref:hypothetical protein n=1 Tax=uncultured Brevundimonas sp. TaxID=213418 RepID=UPI0026087F7F|nr:hypothetical protein [uncultured Brevundimonas sp.]